MLDLLVAYLLRGNVISNILIIAVAVYFVNIYMTSQHEIALKKDEYQHKENLNKQNLDHEMQKSEGERAFTMANSVIQETCRHYTEPKKEIEKGWFKTKEKWTQLR